MRVQRWLQQQNLSLLQTSNVFVCIPVYLNDKSGSFQGRPFQKIKVNNMKLFWACVDEVTLLPHKIAVHQDATENLVEAQKCAHVICVMELQKKLCRWKVVTWISFSLGAKKRQFQWNIDKLSCSIATTTNDCEIRLESTKDQTLFEMTHPTASSLLLVLHKSRVMSLVNGKMEGAGSGSIQEASLGVVRPLFLMQVRAAVESFLM